MAGYDSQGYEEDCVNESDHGEYREFRRHQPELLQPRGGDYRRPSKGQLVELLVRCTGSR